MTYQEALNIIKSDYGVDACQQLWIDDNDGCIDCTQKCQYYYAIEALKKQIPKKPITVIDVNVCPSCGGKVQKTGKWGTASEYDKFCGRCGQAIDWEE